MTWLSGKCLGWSIFHISSCWQCLLQANVLIRWATEKQEDLENCECMGSFEIQAKTQLSKTSLGRFSSMYFDYMLLSFPSFMGRAGQVPLFCVSAVSLRPCWGRACVPRGQSSLCSKVTWTLHCSLFLHCIHQFCTWTIFVLRKLGLR